MKSDNVATAVPLVPRASAVTSVPRRGGAVGRAVWIVALFGVGLAVGGFMFLHGEEKGHFRYKTPSLERGTVISQGSATRTGNPRGSGHVSRQVPGTMLSPPADFHSVGS